MMLGSGVASADLTGQTYDEAAAWISGHKGKAVVGAVSGDQLETGECIVTSWISRFFLDASGDTVRKNDYVLSLNCTITSPRRVIRQLGDDPGRCCGEKGPQFVKNINRESAYCEQDDAAHATLRGKSAKRTGGCEASFS